MGLQIEETRARARRPLCVIHQQIRSHERADRSARRERWAAISIVAKVTWFEVGSELTCCAGAASMPKTRLDDSRWPLVVFTAVGEQTEKDFEEYLADCDAVLRRRQPHGTIFDARRAAPIGPTLRKRKVKWLARNEALLRGYRVATGLVMETPLQRGVLRAILWMRPLPYVYCVESSFEAARHFVCMRLSERGCAPPPVGNWSAVLASTSDGRLREGRRGVHPR
jgi:hypothetical protein